MTPEEKVIFLGLVTTVTLLVSQVAVLQTQVVTLAENIEQLQDQIPEAPDALNYTATGAITNLLYQDGYIVEDSDYDIFWELRNPNPFSYPIIKNQWEQIMIDITRPPDYEYPNMDGLTLVVAFHYEGFNETIALSEINMELGELYPVSTMYPMNSNIVGNCIEFSYQRPIGDYTDMTRFAIFLGDLIPADVQYTMITYYKL